MVMHTDIKVPYLNLKQQYQKLKSEINAAIQNVLDTTSFIKGNAVQEFEKAFAEFVGSKACIGVANGTDALIIALKALGIGAGDEVITVPNTFIATVEAIVAVGATPVLTDINFDTFTIDPQAIPAAITERTKAVIPVHLYGMPCDMNAITAISNEYNLKIIYDGAQAHGACYKGNLLGSYGDITTFSFYPGKNLGAFGDGGAIVCNDERLITRMRMLADHGREDKYVHQFYGYNSRLDTIQAAVLQVKLKYLNQWNQRRREIAQLYSNSLASLNNLKVPVVPDYADPAWHIYAIKTPYRNRMQEHLKEMGIDTGVHYPIPITHQPAAQNITTFCDRQKVKQMAEQILSLPIDPEMTNEMVEYVIRVVNKFCQTKERQL